MNLAGFYTINHTERVSEETVVVSLRIEKEHAVFEGHFPDSPVMPGVAMLQIVKDISETQNDAALQLKSASRIKFINLVNPNQDNTLILTITFQRDNELIKVKNSTTFADERPVMQCNITYCILH